VAKKDCINLDGKEAAKSTRNRHQLPAREIPRSAPDEVEVFRVVRTPPRRPAARAREKVLTGLYGSVMAACR